jgi:hypothetical protein
MVVSLYDDGVAIFRDIKKYKSGNQTWEFIFLDTALLERSKHEVEINDRHKMVGYEYAPGHLYVLYRTGETSRNDFELIDFAHLGGEIKRYNFKPDVDFKLTHFSKAGNSFTFGGYVNNEPAVILFQPAENLISVIPGFFQKDTELVDLRTNLNHTFNTVLIDRGSKQNRKLVFRTYDDTGKLLLEDVVPIDDQRALQNGITSSLVREDLAIMGTWGERNAKQAVGLYFMTVDPFREQEIKYVDFGQMEHFLDHINPKRAERIKANSKEDAKTGTIPNFTTYVMPFRVMEYSEGFLVLAEIYNPVTNLSPYYSNPYYYNPYNSPYGLNPYTPGYYYPGMSRMYRPYSYGNNVRNVEEIKTIASVLISFDAGGKLNWDYSLTFDEMKMPGIEQVSDFALHDQKVHFIYKKESDLIVKSVDLNDQSVTDAKEKVKTAVIEDVIRSEREYEGGVRHWVGNSFFTWGYQTVRNAGKDDRVRDVFYINKIVVR